MSINIYPEVTHAAILSPPEYSTEIDEAVEEIRDATKGFGTDEKKLTTVLGSRASSERYLIVRRYAEVHEKPLYKLMKSETGSGNYGQLLQFLSMPIEEAEAKMIRMATKGMGTSERILYPILCGRSNAEMEILKKAYFKLYEKDLGIMLNGELGGDLKKLIMNCLQGSEEEFDAEHHTEDKAKEDAEEFYKAGQGKKFGSDEKALFKILCNSPPEHIRAVNAAYTEKYGYTLSKALEKELRGTAENAALFTLGMKLNPYETIAHHIKGTCAGIGTDELGLSCAIIRYQHILKSVMMAHIELFNKSVADRVRSETSGNYQALLLEMIRVAWPGHP